MGESPSGERPVQIEKAYGFVKSVYAGYSSACVWRRWRGGLLSTRMSNDPFLLFRWVFVGGIVATLYAGWYLLKNYQLLFGVDASMPSENGSSRAYSKVQVFLIWGLTLKLFVMGALLL